MMRSASAIPAQAGIQVLPLPGTQLGAPARAGATTWRGGRVLGQFEIADSSFGARFL
jgi:hypothetical protein